MWPRSLVVILSGVIDCTAAFAPDGVGRLASTVLWKKRFGTVLEHLAGWDDDVHGLRLLAGARAFYALASLNCVERQNEVLLYRGTARSMARELADQRPRAV